MVLAAITAWCCNVLYQTCSPSFSESYLKSFYKTVCFFQTMFCNDYDTIDSKSFNSKASSSHCGITNYLEYLVNNFTSLSCNITIKSTKVSNSDQKNNLCKIEDLFSVSYNKKSQGSTSLQLLPKAEYCIFKWCEIHDHAHFWWRELYKTWYSFANCPVNKNMPFHSQFSVMSLETRSWIKTFFRSHLGIADFKSFIIFLIIIGATTLIYLNCLIKGVKSKSKKDNTTSESLNSSDVTRLVEFAEATWNDCKKSNETVEAKLLNLAETVQQNIDKLVRENLLINDLYKHVNELEKKCAEYQNQVTNLCNTKKMYEAEIQKRQINGSQIEQLQKELSVLKGQLKFSHQGAAQFQAEKAGETTKLQRNHRDVQNQLAKSEETIILRENVIENLTQTKVRQEDGPDTETSDDETNLQQDPYIVQSIKKIEDMHKANAQLEREIETFTGTKEDKTFLRLKEMLIRNALKLDNIDSAGHFIIRKRRKAALEHIHKWLEILKDKVKD